MRHGPIDTVDGRRKAKGDEPGEAPYKLCPECQTQNFTATRICVSCGYEFPPPEPDLDHRASTMALLSTQQQAEWVNVRSVDYRAHAKPGKPVSLRVTYACGLLSHSEWVCFEHAGYARTKAEAWWRKRSTAPIPATVAEALEDVAGLKEPDAIQVRPVGQYIEITAFRFP